MGVSTDKVRNVIIWGNHSSTQFPDVAHACVENDSKTPVYDVVKDDAWLKGDFIKVSVTVVPMHETVVSEVSGAGAGVLRTLLKLRSADN